MNKYLKGLIILVLGYTFGDYITKGEEGFLTSLITGTLALYLASWIGIMVGWVLLHFGSWILPEVNIKEMFEK